MSAKVYVPRDSGALSLGAEAVARAIAAEASRRGIDVEVVRNGPRGVYWLEPLVEVQLGDAIETPIHGRTGIGHVVIGPWGEALAPIAGRAIRVRRAWFPRTA